MPLSAAGIRVSLALSGGAFSCAAGDRRSGRLHPSAFGPIEVRPSGHGVGTGRTAGSTPSWAALPILRCARIAGAMKTGRGGDVPGDWVRAPMRHYCPPEIPSHQASRSPNRLSPYPGMFGTSHGSGLTWTENDPLGPPTIVARGSRLYPGSRSAPAWKPR